MNKLKLIKFSGWGIAIIFLFLVPTFFDSPYWIYLLIMCGMNVILASSLRTINLTGQLSLAHGGMMTFGAYTTALLVMKLGMSSWLALLITGVATFIIAYIVGYLFMRLKGIYFSMVTLFFALVIILLILQWDSLTEGAMGLINIPTADSISVFGLFTIDFAVKTNFYYLTLVIVLISLLVLYAFEHSRVGTAFRSISQSDSLAESIGIDTTKYKVIAFSVGCFFAGITGGLYAQYYGTLTPESFGFVYTIYVVVYMVVGGSGKFIGPIIGALLLTIVPAQFTSLGKYNPFFFAAILMLVIFFLPKGLVGLPDRIRTLIDNRKKNAGNKRINKKI